MKRKQRNIKSFLLMFMLLSLTLLSAGGFLANNFVKTASAADPPPPVKVFATNETASVGDTIEVYVNISSTYNQSLMVLGIGFWWDVTVLEYVSRTVTIPVERFPGGVLHAFAIVGVDKVNATEGTYTVAANSFGAPFNGSGSVFIMEFRVLRNATGYLHFTRTRLVDVDGESIDHVAIDGKFSTPDFVGEWAPFASFTRQPDIVYVNRTEVTFNASDSYDPDEPEGRIDLYMWDFGDGTRENTTGPIVNHTYTKEESVEVRLVVLDDTGCLSYPFTQGLFVKTYIDISIAKVTISPSQLLLNDTATINVTLSNQGDKLQFTFYVYIYYNETATRWVEIARGTVSMLNPGDNRTLTFNWDTTGVTPERYYRIKAETSYIAGDVVPGNNKRISDAPTYVYVYGDVAIEKVTVSPSELFWGETATINVTVTNLGDSTKSTQVYVYYNETAIDWSNISATQWVQISVQTVLDLGPGSNRTSTFSWDTSTTESERHYWIMANASTGGDLNIINNVRLSDTSIYVRGVPPVAKFVNTPMRPLVNEPVIFDASASFDLDGNITLYMWDFNDGTKENTTNPTIVHVYDSVGNYTVTLEVIDNIGKTDSTTKYVQVIDVVTYLDIAIDVGTIHFGGEKFEFYILVTRLGERVNASEVTAILYFNGFKFRDLTLKLESITTGFYRISDTLPSTATSGTYTLHVEANYFNLKGNAVKSFLVSQTLTGWNALLININGTVGTLKTDLGSIKVKLDAINATLKSIEGRIGTIETDIGTIKTDVSVIKATLTSIEDRIATIESDLGTIKTDINSINGRLTSIEGNVATIETAIGTIKTDINSINANIIAIDGTFATIQTDVGTIQMDVGALRTTISDVQTTATNSLYTTAVFSVLATALFFAVLLILKRKP